ncbi:MAG: hypothetical protein AUK25_08185 [Desulfobacteraceae bacterium CG2_30_51_40]|nr:MAG: hypothetical protein AUK25_08185 [Desulfobacteraceae bacterium CG2_30_51_40]
MSSPVKQKSCWKTKLSEAPISECDDLSSKYSPEQQDGSIKEETKQFGIFRKHRRQIVRWLKSLDVKQIGRLKERCSRSARHFEIIVEKNDKDRATSLSWSLKGDCASIQGSCNHSLCCKAISEERSAGNPHATLRESRRRATAYGDLVREGEFFSYPIMGFCFAFLAHII